MEYISAEEFLKQTKEVQEIFIDWWEPEIGDLFIWIKNDDEYEHDLRKLECCNSFNIVKMTKDFKGINEGDRIPLLTEGQLIKFIEDKTECYISLLHGDGGYEVITGIENFNTKLNNRLQAYWKAACKIAGGLTYAK